MSLQEILSSSPKNKKAIRVGRGIGSGKGKTAGRGHKGQKSRSGVAIKGFEGGQMPIHRRLPKRGFNNIFREKIEIINLSNVQKAIDAGKLDKKLVNKEALIQAGLIKSGPVKLLSNGDLKQPTEFVVEFVSAGAKDKVEKSGGKVSIN